MFKARLIRKGNASSRLKAMRHAVAAAGQFDEVKVGFPVGTAGGLADIAFWNEFGTAGSGKGFMTPRGGGFGGPIPERPFMREGFRGAKGNFKRLMRAQAKQILAGKMTIEEALRHLGVEGEGVIRDSMTSGNFAPNSPLTVELKGSDNPLLDTGTLRRAVSYQVGKRSKLK